MQTTDDSLYVVVLFLNAFQTYSLKTAILALNSLRSVSWLSPSFTKHRIKIQDKEIIVRECVQILQINNKLYYKLYYKFLKILHVWEDFIYSVTKENKNRFPARLASYPSSFWNNA